MQLQALLQKTFGHPQFRPNQEAVCRAATDGRDVLLVMPTGAGKSLCYQLPALARGGTALVISPLIALMDDQAHKLSAAGLKVARIHSGLSRDEARQACRDYLDGNLQFLFIAPERMRVPGFPEMLARRKPSLIAIDEAHCISGWGHDFRPDYRTFGDHLPALRPTPIIALTATATPQVQQDIVRQLGLSNPALFIHGFRRSNLAIEVVEMSKPRRHEFVGKLLAQPGSRPAIVYAPSRKAAEELAQSLGKGASAYHAGLTPDTRERVQRAFLTGKLDIVVATIAFGMGIDKADVRTVVHTALPASVESYYQEIGRAGRDGEPSRTVLLHSYADRKMHDFFLDRDYPAPTELERVAKTLTDDFLMPEILRDNLRMDAGVFQSAMQQLISQGAAQIDIAGNVRRNFDSRDAGKWRSTYDAQINFRRAQIDRMVAFAESSQCRMNALIQHFGDTSDGLKPCGHCDFCNPSNATAQSFRAPDAQEDRHLRALLRMLADAPGGGRSAGKLYTEAAASSLRGVERKQFDLYCDALIRAGLMQSANDTFTNPEGNEITYRKLSISFEGRAAQPGDDLGILLTADAFDTGAIARKPRSRKVGTPPSSRFRDARGDAAEALTGGAQQLEAILRAWRKAEATRTGKPAFIILTDAAIRGIAVAQPRTVSELLAVSGIGPDKADKYATQILPLCSRTSSHTEDVGASRSSQPHRGMRADAAPAPKARPQPQSTANGMWDEAPKAFKRAPEARPAPLPPAPLTPEQELLTTRLQDWRAATAKQLGLPTFFVLASTTLTNLVQRRPTNLNSLRETAGIGPDKVERWGADILGILNTPS